MNNSEHEREQIMMYRKRMKAKHRKRKMRRRDKW